MTQKYSSEMIQRIEELRAEGFSWAEVAKEICEVYDIKATGENLRKAYNYYHAEDKSLEEEIIVDAAVRARRAQMSAARERKVARALTNNMIGRQSILDGIREAVKGVNAFKPNQAGKKKSEGGNGLPMTTELLLSDLQIGKLMPNYNTEIALKRLNVYTESAIFKMRQHIKAGYRMERLVLAMIGDIIESDKKHKNSARATDTGTAAQMKNAMEGLYSLVLKPLATFCEYHNIKFDVVCVTG